MYLLDQEELSVKMNTSDIYLDFKKSLFKVNILKEAIDSLKEIESWPTTLLLKSLYLWNPMS